MLPIMARNAYRSQIVDIQSVVPTCRRVNRYRVVNVFRYFILAVFTLIPSQLQSLCSNKLPFFRMVEGRMPWVPTFVVPLVGFGLIRPA